MKLTTDHLIGFWRLKVKLEQVVANTSTSMLWCRSPSLLHENSGKRPGIVRLLENCIS